MGSVSRAWHLPHSWPANQGQHVLSVARVLHAPAVCEHIYGRVLEGLDVTGQRQCVESLFVKGLDETDNNFASVCHHAEL